MYSYYYPVPTQMVITFDDQYLLTVSEDGCLLIWKIIDKEGRGLKRDKEITYAEEILITKSDLEEKVAHHVFFLALHWHDTWVGCVTLL